MLVLILGILLGIGILCYHVFSYGYVTYVFYGWFVLPYFPQLPHFSVIQFVGVMLFMGAIRPYSTNHLKDECEDKTSKSISIILSPWFLLLVGSIIHSIWF